MYLDYGAKAIDVFSNDKKNRETDLLYNVVQI